MNDTMSLLLASAILATGGLCLFMYKSSDDKSEENDYNEDNLFSANEDNDYDEYDDDFVQYEPKQVRSRSNKTKRNKRSGGSKRRY
jgi:hypothetical protein